MNRRFLAVVIVLSGGLLGCGGIGGRPPCNAPSTTLILDAGVDGLPDVGEYGSAKTCEPFCKPEYPLCYRVDERVLRCFVGCK